MGRICGCSINNYQNILITPPLLSRYGDISFDEIIKKNDVFEIGSKHGLQKYEVSLIYHFITLLLFEKFKIVEGFRGKKITIHKRFLQQKMQ